MRVKTLQLRFQPAIDTFRAWPTFAPFVMIFPAILSRLGRAAD